MRTGKEFYSQILYRKRKWLSNIGTHIFCCFAVSFDCKMSYKSNYTVNKMRILNFYQEKLSRSPSLYRSLKLEFFNFSWQKFNIFWVSLNIYIKKFWIRTVIGSIPDIDCPKKSKSFFCSSILKICFSAAPNVLPVFPYLLPVPCIVDYKMSVYCLLCPFSILPQLVLTAIFVQHTKSIEK